MGPAFAYLLVQFGACLKNALNLRCCDVGEGLVPVHIIAPEISREKRTQTYGIHYILEQRGNLYPHDHWSGFMTVITSKFDILDHCRTDSTDFTNTNKL